MAAGSKVVAVLGFCKTAGPVGAKFWAKWNGDGEQLCICVADDSVECDAGKGIWVRVCPKRIERTEREAETARSPSRADVASPDFTSPLCGAATAVIAARRTPPPRISLCLLCRQCRLCPMPADVTAFNAASAGTSCIDSFRLLRCISFSVRSFGVGILCLLFAFFFFPSRLFLAFPQSMLQLTSSPLIFFSGAHLLRQSRQRQ